MKILLTLIACSSIFLNLCLKEFFERKNFNHRDFHAFVENCNKMSETNDIIQYSSKEVYSFNLTVQQPGNKIFK